MVFERTGGIFSFDYFFDTCTCTYMCLNHLMNFTAFYKMDLVRNHV